MRETLWRKIEEIRREPEHIRQRYVLVCLVVSMIFILGIWLLSLKENFRSFSRTPLLGESEQDLLLKEEPPSLQDLTDEFETLRVTGEEALSGQELFEQQIDDREAGKIEALKKETSSEPLPLMDGSWYRSESPVDENGEAESDVAE